MEALEWLSLGIGSAGVAVIAWGAILALARFIQLEGQRAAGSSICESRHTMRHHFGSYLLLGLEFLVAADVIRTVTKPSLQEVAVLGGIVAIRTVLNYFLNLEIGEHTCGAEEGRPNG
ncbi:MAG: DUF1622 domain-containing protein [Planctomycetota bacterium]